MDCVEKLWLFNLYVSLKFSGMSLMNEMIDEACEMVDHYPEATWLSQILPPGDMAIRKGPPGTSLFHKTWSHLLDDQTAAFSVTLKPHQQNITVDKAASFFTLNDFRAALGDYFVLQQTYAECHGQWKSIPSVILPFSHVHIWHNFQMQQLSTQDECIMLPGCTVQALPPLATMPFGWSNTVLVKDIDGSAEHTPQDSSGEFIITMLPLLTIHVNPRLLNHADSAYILSYASLQPWWQATHILLWQIF
jgi:hypothetical protein